MSQVPKIPRAPAGLTTNSRRVGRSVHTDRPNLAGAELAQLEEACRLIATADRLEESTCGESLAQGSAGQVVAHPALVEARHQRATASTVLERLKLDPTEHRETRSQKARRAARVRHTMAPPEVAPGDVQSSASVTSIESRMSS